MVGQPIEMVSSVSFNDMMKRVNSAQDAESSAHVLVLTALRGKFEGKPFTARDVAEMLRPTAAAQFPDNGQRDAALDDIAELREALESLAGKPFPPGDPQPQAVGKKLRTFLLRPALINGDTVALAEAKARHDGKTYVVAIIVTGAGPVGQRAVAPRKMREEGRLMPTQPPMPAPRQPAGSLRRMRSRCDVRNLAERLIGLHAEHRWRLSGHRLPRDTR